MNQYLKNQILHASHDELFLLYLNKCLVLIKSEEFDTSKFLIIIDVLINSLNREIENSFINDIDALLNFIQFEIIEYNLTKKESLKYPIIKVLEDLRDAWGIRIKS